MLPSTTRLSPARTGARLLALFATAILHAQTVHVDVSPSARRQQIDGFGTCIYSTEGQQSWWQQAFLDDLGATILRIDLVPEFRSPWSDHHYYSPWFKGRGNQPFSLNFEIGPSNQPRLYVGPPALEFHPSNSNPQFYNGPDGNRARTYTGPNDYSRSFGGFNAPIAVMGPNIDDNIARYFKLNNNTANTARAIVNAARVRDPSLAEFKLVGSIWSPAPWLKVSSGNVTSPGYGQWPFARSGTPYPYIGTGGNFVGGRLDVSETPLAVFDDSALPGDPGGPNATAQRGPTSALVQFARSTAAYVRALQNHIGTRFYAISIQNELNFETFYHSCTYPLSAQYILALKYVRAEFDKYDDLRGILIKGPEDLLSDSTYSLWQYGGGDTTVHKNLQYLRFIAQDPQARAALGLVCIHGYASDGVSSAGADPVAWERWANGWTASPAAGIPPNVQGFRALGLRSWMTETSGESPAWLHPAGSFPNNGAFSIAVKMHQALTTGWQSAWIYWQMTDGSSISESTLTDSSQRSNAGKFTALRHYSKFIRPGAVRVGASVSGSSTLLASAYVHDANRTFTIVLVNTAPTDATATVLLPVELSAITQFSTRTSRNGSLWQSGSAPIHSGAALVPLPGYGVVTLHATDVGEAREAPVLFPAGGTFSRPVEVSITVPPLATVRYTTDGSDPGPTSTAYVAPFTVTTSTTVRARAFYADGASSTVDAPFELHFYPGTVLINAGGLAASPFLADGNYAGGAVAPIATEPVDVSSAAQPAPQSVYKTARTGASEYLFAGLPVGPDFRLRLHFCDNEFGAPGQRLFDVVLNGAIVAASVDVVGLAGGRSRALVLEYLASARPDGTLSVEFRPGAAGQPLINGLELLPTNAADVPVASLPSGIYWGTQTVQLTAPTSGSTVVYTVDGTDPSSSGTAVTAAPPVLLPISNSTTIRAFARADGFVDSPELRLEYVLRFPRLLNLSTRGHVSSGAGVLIPGLVVRGPGLKTVLVRAAGATLADPPFSVQGTLPAPELTLYNRFGEVVARNSNWLASPDAPAIAQAARGVGAFPFNSTGGDAAVLAQLGAGTYTVHINSAVPTATGIALAEVYDLEEGTGARRLVNLSTRGSVGDGSRALIAGFVIEGSLQRRVLIRAVGPTLGSPPYSVPGALANPRLTVFHSSGAVVAANDDWGDDAQVAAAAAQVGAFALLAASRDAALVTHLPPGAYTAHVSGGSGIAIVEVYELD